MKPDPSQLDFFLEPLFPVRSPVQRIDIHRYRAQMKRAMARAIRECPYDRPTVAARMAQYLGLPSISKAVLDAYTAESKNTHDITLPRFAAFVHATGAVWLWDEAASIQGVTMLVGEEALLAEIAYRQQEQRRLAAELKTLMARPIELTSRGKR
ncbi:hypothetical protein MZK49_06875 [Ensifer sesbaniae]|uniref:hypothetical protein n=1 Tax=Ensifer sesbaniae TaxID=1214071 RepID=UPI002000F90C|nr:hypothetical protein [Ensifer sesbaniae]